MNILEFFDQTKYPKNKAFGTFVKSRRKELGYTIQNLADKTNLSTTYIFDIENSNRNAPIKHLQTLMTVLQVTQEQTDLFMDLAGMSTGHYPDITEYLNDKPHAREFLRVAKRKNLSGEEVLQVVKDYEEIKAVKEAEKE